MDNRDRIRKLRTTTDLIAGIGAASILVLWGAVNLSLTIRSWMAQKPELADADWIATAVMSLVFGGLPLALGAWLMYRKMVK